MTAIGRLEQLETDLCRLVLEKHHQTNMATRHIAVETWLEALGMMEYLHCFTKYGGVEDLLYLSEVEVRDLGLKNSAHRAKIVSSLRILREKYERTRGGPRTATPQHLLRNNNATAQLSWSPPSMVNSPDYQVVNVPPEQIQQDLISELQGNPADLKSRAWYHGTISRQHAERAISRNGDFLVRDSISSPGDFVLTCFWKGGPIHFVINSTVSQPTVNQLPKVTYHFEDEKCNSVQELIQFYMDECKPITDISGAVITTPIARTMPLSYYDSKYGALTANSNNNASLAHYALLPNSQNQFVNRSPRISPMSSPHRTPGGSPQRTPGGSPHRTPGGSPGGSPGSVRKVERAGSQPVLAVNDVQVGFPNMDRSGSLPMITGLYQQTPPTGPPNSFSHTLPRQDTGIYKQVSPVASPMYSGSPQVYSGSTQVYSGTPQMYSGSPQIHSGNQQMHSGTPQMYTGTAPTYSASPQMYSAAQPTHPPAFIHQRSGSAPVLLTPGVTVTHHFERLTPPTQLNPASSEGDLHNGPPPKPSRIPSVKYKKKPVVQIRNKALYADDDRDYSDYSQVKEEPSWVKQPPANHRQGETTEANQKIYNNNTARPLVQQNSSFMHNHDLNQNISKSDSRKISDTSFSVLDGHDYADIPAFPLELNLSQKPQDLETIDEKTRIKIPEILTEASFDLAKYPSCLLPDENKLLEPSVLLKMRQVVLDTSPKDLASYLTKEDLTILKVLNTEDVGVFVTSGLELITLPQGKQLRQDILERIYCMKAITMVMILTCPKVTERAAMLSQWIQIAMETKQTLGNLFGFENIMDGLMSNQIQRLRDTWMILRQSHTHSAFIFDTKLKSSYRLLNDGSGTLAVQNISIPSITPVVQLLERDTSEDHFQALELAELNNSLDVMLIHLDMARVITAQCGVYKIVGETVMKGLEADDEKSEMFRTEFHMRFLWGYKGAGVNRAERHNKFNLLLKAYSEKIEREDDDGTAV